MGLGSYLRGRAQGNMLPQQGRSALVANLLQQSMQQPFSGSPVESLNIASKPILAALLAKQEDKARTTQQQALAGALSRVQQPGARGEAARRASTIIAGGSPDSPLAQAILGMQAESTFAPQHGNLIGSASPDAYEPASVQRFSETGNYADLKPRFNAFGKYNPGDYTPESWAKFLQTGDESVLARFAPSRIVDTSGGGVAAVDPVNNRATTVISDTSGTEAAAARKRAEAEAAATGEAAGKAEGAILARATSAQGIIGVLDLVDPLIDASTSSLAGAGRDKLLGAFGYAPDAAQANAQLKVLQATLMTQQPRMEGPQSDRDVQLYREAAGQIGDPTVPAGLKKAASAMIRALNMKYIDRAVGQAQAPSGAPDFKNMSDEELRRLAGGQ